MTLRPESAEFLDWCRGWLTERGYKVQDSLPWKSWKCSTPTIVYCLDGRGLPAFGLLSHFIKLADLVKRIGIFMTSKPSPVAIFLFVPANAPFDIEIELEGAYTYSIEIVESPDYGYGPRDNEDHEWESSFSISLRAREPPE